MDLRSLMLGLVFALMWSSAFTSARMIVAEASPLAALSVRFLISGLLGVLIARFLGQTMRLTQAQWRATIVFGIFQNAIYLGLNFVAMQTIEASVASIIASSMPLMVALAGWLVSGWLPPFSSSPVTSPHSQCSRCLASLLLHSYRQQNLQKPLVFVWFSFGIVHSDKPNHQKHLVFLMFSVENLQKPMVFQCFHASG